MDFKGFTSLGDNCFKSYGWIECPGINGLAASFSIKQASNLKLEALQNIVDGLVQVEITQTISLTSAQYNRLSNEYITRAINKNWTFAVT